MSRSAVLNGIRDCGAVVILRLPDHEKILPIADAILQGGLNAIEITLNTPYAVEAISLLKAAFKNDILLGAGTVLNKDQVETAIQAGARYVISPIFKPEIIHTAHAYDCLAIPGCLTPTEMFQALETGAEVIKLFPADSFSPGYIKSILAPLNNLRIMPTGGINASNAAEWIRAGAFCLGAGSAILDNKAIEEDDYSVLTERARELYQAIHRTRESEY